MQGREFSGPESLDTKLQAFVQQVGGKQRAKIISRLMHRGLVDMALTLFATDQKISSVVNGEAFKEARIHSQGGSSRVCLDNGHRAVLNVKSNALGNNGGLPMHRIPGHCHRVGSDAPGRRGQGSGPVRQHRLSRRKDPRRIRAAWPLLPKAGRPAKQIAGRIFSGSPPTGPPGQP